MVVSKEILRGEAEEVIGRLETLFRPYGKEIIDDLPVKTLDDLIIEEQTGENRPEVLKVLDRICGVSSIEEELVEWGSE